MSTASPQPSSHRHTRSTGIPPQNLQNAYYFNTQASNHNSQSDMNFSNPPTTPPKTPHKSDFNNAIRNDSLLESAPKPRSKGKNRPKNLTESPAVSRNNRNVHMPGGDSASTPGPARQISTPSAAAYAGPTFHASPAPSALPIPSFYSKSVPDSPGAGAFSSRPTDDTSSNSSDSPTRPAAQVLAAEPRREESPLDLFFKADREEKARARSASSSLEFGPFAPPRGSNESGYSTPAQGSHIQNDTKHFAGGAASRMFAMELDGSASPGTPYGPTFSTPYSQRINAARSANSPQNSSTQSSSEQQQNTDRSEALKAYLFSGQNQNSPVKQSTDSLRNQSYANNPRNTSPAGGSQPNIISNKPNYINFPGINNTTAPQRSPRTGSRSSGLRQEVTPTKTPIATPERANNNYQSSPTPSRFNIDNVSAASNIGFSSPQSSSPMSRPISGTNSHADLKGMEDSLRRILKLEPSSDSGVQG